MLTIAAVLGFKEQFKPTQPILDIFSNIECKGIDQFESVRPAFILLSGKHPLFMFTNTALAKVRKRSVKI